MTAPFCPQQSKSSSTVAHRERDWFGRPFHWQISINVGNIVNIVNVEIYVRTTIVSQKICFQSFVSLNDEMTVDSRQVGIKIDAVTDVTYEISSSLMHVPGV